MSERALTTGIVYVAFGRNYNFQCAYSARSVRALSRLPIHVFTNGDMEPVWEGITGVTVTRKPMEDKDNRAIKTQLGRLSPFDRTLYLDTDTAVQKGTFRAAFALLNDHDVLGVLGYQIVENADWCQTTDVYRMAHEMLGFTFPLRLIHGGVLFFRKSEPTRLLFERWHSGWKKLGRGRDMPALAWALQHTPSLKFHLLDGRWCSERIREDTVIAHAFGNKRIAGIPAIVKYMPEMKDNHTWVKRPWGLDLTPTEAPVCPRK